MLKTKKLLKKNQNSRYFHIDLLQLNYEKEKKRRQNMDDFYNDFGFDIINQNNMDDLNQELYDFGLESTNDYLSSSLDDEWW